MPQKNDHPHEITPDKYRFVNLGLFLLAAVSNSIPCQAFAGVAPAITQIYCVSGLAANANSLFFPIMYVIMILPANYVIDVKGIKIGTLLCQFLMCLGLTIRCLINTHFSFFLIGTFICSIGFCFTTSAANKFPNIWFLEKEIFAAKSLILFVLFASDTVGFYISTVFITKSSTKHEVQMFFVIQSAILIAFHILNAIFFKDLPQTPQNYSSQIKRQQYLKNLKKLFKHKNYLKLFLVITFVFANLSIIFIGVAWLGQAYDISTQKCGYILVIANGAGLVGCALSGFILKDRYKFKCKIFLIGGFISFALMWVAFQSKEFWIICVSAALIGINIFPFLTTILDFASQTTFPIGQATSGGSLLFGGQTFGFFMIIIFSIYINDDVTLEKCRVTQGILLVFLVIGFFFLHLSKQDLKRKKYQEKIKVQERASLISENATYLDD